MYLTFKLVEALPKKAKAKIAYSWKVDLAGFREKSKIVDTEIYAGPGDPKLVVRIF